MKNEMTIRDVTSIINCLRRIMITPLEINMYTHINEITLIALITEFRGSSIKLTTAKTMIPRIQKSNLTTQIRMKTGTNSDKHKTKFKTILTYSPCSPKA